MRLRAIVFTISLAMAISAGVASRQLWKGDQNPGRAAAVQAALKKHGVTNAEIVYIHPPHTPGMIVGHVKVNGENKSFTVRTGSDEVTLHGEKLD